MIFYNAAFTKTRGAAAQAPEGGERNRESRKHTHSASCNTLSLPRLASFQIISICERISPERHASKSFLCLRYICARSKEILQAFSLMREWKREGRGGICCTAIRNICKKLFCIFFPFPFYVTATVQKLRLRLDFPASTSPHVAMTGSLYGFSLHTDQISGSGSEGLILDQHKRATCNETSQEKPPFDNLTFLSISQAILF